MSKLNNNGFTLVEITVSLLIASIGMVIATTLILNSMGYFNKTVASDIDKQALDGIKDYVQNELIFASEVKIDNQYPSEETDEDYKMWHWLFVKDGVLYRDDNFDVDKDSIPVYNDDFYNKRELEINARGFESFRIDLKFKLNDDSDTVYKTATSIELLNMKQNILVNAKVSPFDKSGNTRSLKKSSTNIKAADGYAVFYKKEIIDSNGNSNIDPDVDFAGTVADQIACMTDKNNTGQFQAGTTYKPGEMCYLIIDGQKVWFRCVTGNKVDNEAALLSNNNLWWKRIEAYHSKDSGYLVGDIVIDKETNQYYQCIQKTTNQGRKIPVTDILYWKKIDKPTEPNKKCEIDGAVSYNGTVADKDDDLNFEDIPLYEELTGQGHIDIFVRYDNDVWVKLVQGDGGTAPGEKNKGKYVWQKIQMIWDEHSGYLMGDIIYYKGNFYKATTDVLDGTIPAYFQNNSSWVANNGWKKVTYNETTGKFDEW